MANGRTITQRIALEGGEDIRKQLESIGKAGQEAFKRFTDAANAQQILTRFGGTLDSIKARAEAVGVAGRRLGDDFSDLGNRVRTSARNIAIIGAVITGVVTGFTALVKGAADAADKLEETAEAAGTTAENLSNLQFAAQLNGLDSDKFNAALLRLNRSMDEQGKRAGEQIKKQRDLSRQFNSGAVSAEHYLASSQRIREDAAEQSNAFTRLGVSVRNSDGSLRDSREVLLDLADTFREMPDGASKSALAVELFGRGASGIVPLLNRGSQGIRALETEAVRVAPALTKFQAQIAGKLSDAFDVFQKASKSARDSVLLTFAPSLTRVVNAFTESIVANRTRMVELASTIADRLRPLVDDLIAILQGRGADITSGPIAQARDAVLAVGNAITGIVIPALSALLAALDTVAQSINALFGTNLTGTQLAAALVITKLIGLFGVLAASIKVVISTVALLVAAFGGVPVAIAAIGIAFGLLLTQAAGGVEGIRNAWQGLQAFVTSIFSGIGSGVTSLASGIVTAFSDALSAVGGFFRSLFDTVMGVFDRIVAAAKRVASAISSVVGGGGMADGGAVGFAGGGRVRGPGTSRSDSIPARLSRGEYVIQARAVDHYGPGLFDALNRMRLRLGDIGRGFNMGGLVEGLAGSLMPPLRMADGGLVAAGASGGQPLNLHLPGGQMVKASVTNQEGKRLLRILGHEAVKGGVASAGRKPTWFGG